MGASITVLYPNPTDVEKFEKDYEEHMQLFHEHLPNAPTPQLTKVKQNPKMPAPYHRMFVLHFDSMDDLKETLMSEGMKTVGGHANQISSGGAPVIMVGVDDQS